MAKQKKDLVLFFIIDKRLGSVQIYDEEGSAWANQDKYHQLLKVKFKAVEVEVLTS